MPRVLVIDDDPHMRNICARVLSKAGWSVDCAPDGEDGLRQLEESPEAFEVILLDQLMPGLDGMDVLARIQAMDPGVPVILMTGSATEEYRSEVVKKGAFDCLPKPFTPEQLRAATISAAHSHLTPAEPEA
jgi:two-component system, OmpR family, phosphate regulon sensor histidine kinase PhoR